LRVELFEERCYDLDDFVVTKRGDEGARDRSLSDKAAYHGGMPTFNLHYGCSGAEDAFVLNKACRAQIGGNAHAFDGGEHGQDLVAGVEGSCGAEVVVAFGDRRAAQFFNCAFDGVHVCLFVLAEQGYVLQVFAL
jgi:hypothetical protein